MGTGSLDETTLPSGAAARRPSPELGAGPSVPALTVLFHPDSARIGDRALLRPLLRGHPAALSRREPLFGCGARQERPLGDRHLSRSPWLLTAEGEGVRLDPGSSPFPLRIGGSEVVRPRTLQAEELEAGVVLELAGRIVLLLHRHRLAMAAPPAPHGLVGESSGLVRVRSEIERVADLEVPVLLRGETGTGKELVAAAVHQASGRDGAFVAVNLAAVPESLAAAELFGARKGAFTGASQAQPGYFLRAERGTLFLDEVAEASSELQAQLLRVLETGEIQPLGGQQPTRVDVRLVAATDADLEARIADGRFRSPLLHRLAGFEIRLPPLRDRRDDFGRLLLHFLGIELERVRESHRLAADDATRWLDPGLVARLAALPWPGNVRQLRNAVRQLVIGSRGLPKLDAGPALERLLAGEPEMAPGPSPTGAPRRARRKPSSLSEEEVRQALESRRFDLKTTAEELGISRTSLYALLERFPTLRAPAEIRNPEIRRAFEECGGDLEAMVARLELSKRTLRRRLRELGLI
ncbi:MAG: sigma 54-interacting transcriptional regulator [Holophagales bacterium]|nr:sigma 54-interacting transcriptional regulator [Holophagales bacterium]